MKQLTGRANYQAFIRWQAAYQADFQEGAVDYEENPDVLIQLKCAAKSAAFFWVGNHLLGLADRGSTPDQVNEITAVVNFHTDDRWLDANAV